MSVEQISPQNAFELLKNQKNSVLIDVRTMEELSFVGVVNASSFENRLIFLAWQTLPQMEQNQNFANDLLAKVDKDNEVLFLCRTGGRSNQSAQLASTLGFKKTYNIINGFEGDLNSQNHRGLVNGWKASNLPWEQK
jgi:rhodanese-related sulfurtransferase